MDECGQLSVPPPEGDSVSPPVSRPCLGQDSLLAAEVVPSVHHARSAGFFTTMPTKKKTV